MMSNFFSHTSDGENASTAGSSDEKKLRLFGFELNPCNNNNNNGTTTTHCLKVSAEGDESVNSSNSASSSSASDDHHQKPSSSRDHKPSSTKFECQYCFKEFANSQALGGHQNAHKKERMKKKRLQLQTKKDRLNSYLQPYYHHHQNNLTFNNVNNCHASSTSTAWFYDPSCYPSDNNQFTLYEESQISFNTYDHHQAPHHQDSNVFTLTTTHAVAEEGSGGEHRPAVIIKPSPPLSAAATLNQSCCKPLDLQLGLSLQSKSGV